VRGIKVFEDLSNDYGLHLFRSSRFVRYVVRRRFDASAVGSKRLRRAAEARELARHGNRVVVYELQGELTLFSIERVIRELLELPREVKYLIVDFKRVSSADGPALDLWLAFLDGVRERYDDVVLTDFRHDAALAARLAAGGSHRSMEETDAALELCEDRLLGDPAAAAQGPVRLEDFDLCAGLDKTRIETLRQVLELRHYEDGEIIIRKDDPANALFFLMSGEVSVIIDLPTGGTHRLNTCRPGMLFGEMAILERRPRSAAVRADGPVECYAMSRESFERLTATHPDLKVKLLENFAQTLSLRVRKLTDEVRALSD
jgi:glutaminase